MNIDIESDNIDVNKMVYAAKWNQWETVRNILDQKPYLINCIPEKRAWSVLHQAVYWNKSTIVTHLLGYNTCDAIVKSKQCYGDMLDASSTPMKLAENRGYDDIKKLLTENIDKHRALRFGNVLRFVTKKRGQQIAQMGFPLFVLEVVMYKNALVGPNSNIKDHSINMMKQIFQREEHCWEKIEEQLYQALYGHCRQTAEEIRKAHANNEKTFFENLISLYTGNLVYSKVNEALGREFDEKYRPAADELALGLYALLLDVTITFWPDLEKFKEPTYRGIPVNVTNKYQEKEEIMFTTMVSCSRSREKADNFRKNNHDHKDGTLFIFDNSHDSSYHPRRIEAYSIFDEQECLYVLGTLFRVDNVNEYTNIVSLSLL